MNHNQYIKRDIYLEKLILRRDNGEVKVITGLRRCGKSWLLSHIYHDYLIENGVREENIIIIDFDKDDDKHDFDVLDHKAVKEYIYSLIKNEDENYYVFLDEIQELDNFERLVNGLNGHENIDVYVTGSNSRFLSKDISTIFRGRGDEIRVFPLSFREFSQMYDNISEAWKEYFTFGGMENVLYNHLRVLGFLVDVGVVESREMNDGKLKFVQREIDFVVNKGDQKYYIQSAYSIPTEEKREEELASLLKVSDSFQKIVVVADDIMPYTDDNGIYFTGLFDFLLKDEWQ